MVCRTSSRGGFQEGHARPGEQASAIDLAVGQREEAASALLEYRDRADRVAGEFAVALGLAVLVLSAHVEDSYATELLADGRGGVGYLLKERVGKVADFLEALERVAAGGTAMDPEVVAQLLVRRRTDDPLHSLTPRERETLALMAEGHSNATIAGLLKVSDGAVHKHIGNIFSKLGMPTTDAGHRRVLAVLAYLKA
ncbi:LuxR C-terminal-related transcriptional regulator [Streptomyces sp. NPDC059743]|uniref:LuxR C-terminal-related transcriptional regulator n=1 Tax=Streptomyces sp. NPDC059743 TaxID=3346928 RepID=UPI00364FC26D